MSREGRSLPQDRVFQPPRPSAPPGTMFDKDTERGITSIESVRSMSDKSGRTFEILVVEDNPGDVRLLQETLRDSPHEIRFTVAEDGEAAMEILGKDHGCHTPDLILLDLNLPKKDGREVLSEIKEDPALSRIPVVVLTSSQADKARLYSEQHHANGYFNKPISANVVDKLVKALTDY